MICDNCGKEGAEKTTCPYDEDVNDTTTEICVCDDCYQQHVDDI